MTTEEKVSYDEDETFGLIAIGLAHEFWRGQGPVENRHLGHRHINDGEMFTANVRVTRICLRHLRGGIDFDDLLNELSSVPLAGDRTARDLLGPDFAQWESAVLNRVDDFRESFAEDDDGVLKVFSSLAGFANVVAPHWWSGPKWAAMVDAFVDGLTGLPLGVADKDVLRTTLLDAPDDLGIDALEWCVRRGIRASLQ